MARRIPLFQFVFSAYYATSGEWLDGVEIYYADFGDRSQPRAPPVSLTTGNNADSAGERLRRRNGTLQGGEIDPASEAAAPGFRS